jgi:hypothetical protein
MRSQAAVRDADLAIISAGSFHHLTTRAEQLRALSDVKQPLQVGGTLVLNILPVDEIIGELAPNDLEIWHLNHGFWKQARRARASNHGITGHMMWSGEVIIWELKCACGIGFR